MMNSNCILKGKNLANATNESFVNMNMLVLLISINHSFILRASTLIIPVELVKRRLQNNKVSKASDPDSTSKKLLKNFLAELATPFGILIFRSFKQTTKWKAVDVITIPKHQDINSDLCSICLTATLSKLLESFNAEWILDNIQEKLALRKFGAVPGPFYFLSARSNQP